MARFRCPSLSSMGSVQSVVSVQHAKKRRPPARVETVEDNAAGPSRPVEEPRFPPTFDRQARPSKKVKSKARASVKDSQAKRVERLRKEVKKTIHRIQANRHEWSFVYVGNLSSSLENENIWKHFAKCGPIAHIEMRASMGICVPTSKLPKPLWGPPLEGTHYASIQFTTPDGARKALELSGTELGGRKIIVTLNVIDLPETISVVKEHLEQPPRQSFWQRKYGQVKRLTWEKTEAYIDPDNLKATDPPSRRVAAKRLKTTGDQNRNDCLALTLA